MKLVFFNFYLDHFSIMAKRMQSNQEQHSLRCSVEVRHVFIFRCALTMGLSNTFQDIFWNQKKSEISGANFETMLFLVTIMHLSISNYLVLLYLTNFFVFKIYSYVNFLIVRKKLIIKKTLRKYIIVRRYILV